jgi:hypothetical protein
MTLSPRLRLAVVATMLSGATFTGAHAAEPAHPIDASVSPSRMAGVTIPAGQIDSRGEFVRRRD